MTEKEVEERLNALPYDVPEDIKPAYIPPMMEMNGIEGNEAEEEFWEKLHHLSPEKQQEFFHAAGEAQSAGKSMALTGGSTMAEERAISMDPEERTRLEVSQKHYTERKFWKKVRRWAKRAGRGVMKHALVLYYAARDPDTPQHIRAFIYGALGYFISPIDVVPDVLFGAGFMDDLAILAVLISQIATYIKPEHHQQACERLKEWFGSGEEGNHPEDDPQPA